MLRSAPGSECRCSASLGAPQRQGREWTPGVVIVPWQASFVRADKTSLKVLRWVLVDQTWLTARHLEPRHQRAQRHAEWGRHPETWPTVVYRANLNKRLGVSQRSFRRSSALGKS